MSKLIETLSGKNKAGRILFAVLDVLPIPSIHEVIKAVLSKDGPETTADALKAMWARIDLLRLTLGGAFGAILCYLLAKGLMSEEVFTELIRAIILALFGG